MTARTWLRSGLVVLMVVQGALGGWQLLLPRAFYDDFPLPTHPWVAMLPPYNAHLIVDAGAANLAMAVMIGAAALSLHPALVRTVLLGAVVFAALHFGFHATHLQHFPRPDAVGQTVALAGWLVLVVGLLVVELRMPRSEP